jgi:hypothetical protein
MATKAELQKMYYDRIGELHDYTRWALHIANMYADGTPSMYLDIFNGHMVITPHVDAAGNAADLMLYHRGSYVDHILLPHDMPADYWVGRVAKFLEDLR